MTDLVESNEIEKMETRPIEIPSVPSNLSALLTVSYLVGPVLLFLAGLHTETQTDKRVVVSQRRRLVGYHLFQMN